MKINQKQLKIWISALRSGYFKQTKGSLQNGGRYCCLGVACKVLIPESKQYKSYGNQLLGGTPVIQGYAPKWLIKISLEVEKITGTNLVEYNDVYKFKFKEIADLLEQLFVEDF